MLFKVIASGVFAAVPLGSNLPAGDTVLVGEEALEASGAKDRLPANVPPDRVLGVFTSAPTGGYSLKVLGVKARGDTLLVKAELVPPKGPAIQVITHPWVLLLLEEPAKGKTISLELKR